MISGLPELISIKASPFPILESSVSDDLTGKLAPPPGDNEIDDISSLFFDSLTISDLFTTIDTTFAQPKPSPMPRTDTSRTLTAGDVGLYGVTLSDPQ